MIAFIDEYRGDYGVEPICRILPIAPSTYHEHLAQRHDPSRLRVRRARSLTPPSIAQDVGCNLEDVSAQMRNVGERSTPNQAHKNVLRQVLGLFRLGNPAAEETAQWWPVGTRQIAQFFAGLRGSRIGCTVHGQAISSCRIRAALDRGGKLPQTIQDPAASAGPDRMDEPRNDGEIGR